MSCVSIPPQTTLISRENNELSDSVSAGCRIDEMHRLGNIAEAELQLNPAHISLINWNIYKAQRENWAHDFKQFIAAQDLLLLQEAVASPQLKSMLNQRHLYWNLNTAFYLNSYETGVLTASTIKPVYSCGLRTTEPLIRMPKTALISVYPVAGSDKKLLVANLHGINFTLGTEAYAEQIQNMVSIVKQHTGPVIIAGDFNTWSEQRIVLVNDMAQKLSLQTVTYDIHNRVRVFGHALDHVFYRGLEVTHEEVIKVSSSDHNPIKVVFRLAEKIQHPPLQLSYK